MTTSSEYRKGYQQGFQAGYQTALAHCRQNVAAPPQDKLTLPLESLGLSSRALNCLRNSGCQCLGDVCSLSEHQIATMRNLGVKTAAEIAEVLAEYGLRLTHWAKYHSPAPQP